MFKKCLEASDCRGFQTLKKIFSGRYNPAFGQVQSRFRAGTIPFSYFSKKWLEARNSRRFQTFFLVVKISFFGMRFGKSLEKLLEKMENPAFSEVYGRSSEPVGKIHFLSLLFPYPLSFSLNIV